MVCPFCQAELSATDKMCPMCGAPVDETPTQKPETQINYDIPMAIEDPGKTQGMIGMIMGIASLVLGLSGCCCCGAVFGLAFIALFFVTSIVSLILSISASKKSKAAGYTNTCATVGIIVSAVSVGILLFLLVFAIVYLAIYGIAGLSGLLGELGGMY